MKSFSRALILYRTLTTAQKNKNFSLWISLVNVNKTTVNVNKTALNVNKIGFVHIY